MKETQAAAPAAGILPENKEPAPYVSIVIPAYNEEQSLGEDLDIIREAFESSPYTYEIIVVDDASTDDTVSHVLARPWVTLIRRPVNQGSGASRKVGTLAARGEVVVWTDGDRTYPNQEIPHLVADLDGYDQVVGARRSEEGTHKVLRVPAKWAIRSLASYLAETPIPDLNSGLRVFRKEVAAPYLNLLPRGFSCVSTITLAFLCNDHLIKYVPIDYYPRLGRSKFHPIADAYRYILQVVRMIMYFNPLKIFMPLGLMLLGVGAGKLAYDLIAHPFKVAIITVVVLMAALNVLSIGLLADLIVRRTRHVS